MVDSAMPLGDYAVDSERVDHMDSGHDLGMLLKPSVFAGACLGLKLHDWQMEALDALEGDGSRLCLRTCNGSGKTSMVVASAVIWHMSVFPESVCVSTAGVMRQVTEQLMPNLRRILSNCPSWKITEQAIEAPNGSRYFGFTATDSGKFEGWHTPERGSGEKSSLLMIVDEAKTVPEEIFDAIERCQANRVLVASSPGIAAGRFHSFSTRPTKAMKSIVVPYTRCPHLLEGLNARIREDQIERFGLNSPLVRSMIMAEFADDDSQNLVFSAESVDACMSGFGRHERHGRKSGAIDLSVGGDETVLMVRDGNKVVGMKTWHEPDAVALARMLVKECKHFGLEPEDVCADAGGLGRPIIDLLSSLGFPIRSVLFNSAPRDKALFANLRTEMYFDLALRMRRGSIMVDRDEKLREQLLAHTYRESDKGTYRLDPKDQMKESPDRADALAMLFLDAPMDLGTDFKRDKDNAKRWSACDLEAELDASDSAWWGGMTAWR